MRIYNDSKESIKVLIEKTVEVELPSYHYISVDKGTFIVKPQV